MTVIHRVTAIYRAVIYRFDCISLLEKQGLYLDPRLAYNLYVILNSVCIFLMQFHGHLDKLGGYYP